MLACYMTYAAHFITHQDALPAVLRSFIDYGVMSNYPRLASQASKDFVRFVEKIKSVIGRFSSELYEMLE